MSFTPLFMYTHTQQDSNRRTPADKKWIETLIWAVSVPKSHLQQVHHQLKVGILVPFSCHGTQVPWLGGLANSTIPTKVSSLQMV